MDDSEDETLLPWVDGVVACGFVSSHAWDDLEDVDEKKAAKVIALLQDRYAVFGPQNLARDQLNTEGHVNIEGQRIHICALKAGQVRLYCAEGSFRGNRALFATLALTKKQQKAEPKELKKAAMRAVEYVDKIPGASL